MFKQPPAEAIDVVVYYSAHLAVFNPFRTKVTENPGRDESLFDRLKPYESAFAADPLATLVKAALLFFHGDATTRTVKGHGSTSKTEEIAQKEFDPAYQG